VDGQFVGLLVKNLENIQGDERDIVILSICYGPGPDGRMLMNFGPINKSGGEKRLNVAFSRAKHHMVVVSSVRHASITNDYNDGAACLKNYLHYTEALSDGAPDAAKRILSGISRWRESNLDEGSDDDQVCCQLASALRQNGYQVDLNVGHSHFRVDIAVRRGTERSYCLGILIDTPIKYEQFDTMEREMMRPRLLRSFGWRLTCVLAKDWYFDRDREIQRVLGLLDGTGDDELTVTDESGEAEDELVEMEDSLPHVESLSQSEDDGSDSEESVDGVDVREQYITVSTLDIMTPALAIIGPNQITDGSTRYFEYGDSKSSKFWEISLDGPQHTVRFGRIGTKGQSQSKMFSDAASAEHDASRLIREKTRKGYREFPGSDRSLS
jgi:predicted DNA-binding WGR domain protein